jgi:hypothetical protein
MSWLRIDDGFSRHPKVTALTHKERWTWMEILCYAARYQTGGWLPENIREFVPGATPKLVARCLELALLDDEAGELRVHHWEEYAPKDPTGAERQAAWRKRKRDGDVTETVTAGVTANVTPEPSTSRAYAPARPVQSPREDQEHRPVEDDESGNLETLSFAHALRLFAAIRDGDKDDHTRQVILSYSHKLPPAAFEGVREELLEGQRTIRNQGAWVNSRLSKLTEERQIA